MLLIVSLGSGAVVRYIKQCLSFPAEFAVAGKSFGSSPSGQVVIVGRVSWTAFRNNLRSSGGIAIELLLPIWWLDPRHNTERLVPDI